MSFRPQPHYGLPINTGPFGMKFEDDYLVTLRNAGSVKWKQDCEEGSVVLRSVSCYLQQEVKTGLPL